MLLYYSETLLIVARIFLNTEQLAFFCKEKGYKNQSFNDMIKLVKNKFRWRFAMKKFTNLLGFALLLNLLGFIALLAYRVNFDVAATLQVIYAFAYSAVSPLIDFSSINLFQGLQWFAVILYTFASLLLIVNSIKKLNLLRILVSPLGLVFTLAMSIILINGYYPNAVGFDNLGTKTDFWSLILLPLEVANPGLRASAFSGLIVSAGLLTIIFHIFVLFDFVRNPYGKKQGLMMPILKEETIIAQELSTFVIPNQIKISSPELPKVSSPSSTPSETHSLFNPTPIIALPTTPSLPEKSEISNARQTVLQLKDKIRGLIRLQLVQAKQAIVLSAPSLSQQSVVSPTQPVQVAPLVTTMVQEQKQQEDARQLIQEQVNQAIATEIAQLEPKSKDQVTTLINEELIKYDSLNREVMESLVAEKIEQQIGNALDQYKQEVGLMIEKTLDESKLKVQSTLSTQTQNTLSSEELNQRIQQALEENPLYKKMMTFATTPEQVGESINESSPSIQAPGITSTDVVNLIQNHTLSQLQIQQLLDEQHQKLLTVIQQLPKEDLSQLMTKAEFNLALNQLTQTKQDLIQQHQDIMTLKDVLSQFQLETLGRIQPLQEKLQQYESKPMANVQIKPVEEAFIVALMQKHQSTLKPQESLEVISSMVATEVKKQSSTEPKLNAVDVEKMITEAVGRIPQPAAVEMPRVMSEEAITKLVESKLPRVISEEDIQRMVDAKLPKQDGPVMNEEVISSMVATEVKKQSSSEPKLNAVDVEKMITEAVGRIPKQVYIQENTASNNPNTNSSYNSRMVSPTLTIPVIRKKNAKAPENEKRADQFKSVITPEVGVTRTGKKKIVRIPFQDRMSLAEPMLLAHYDELKNYILSFQVKSRISNAGDIFRLHKEEYVKITIAGKGLKLYMALNPEDYKDGPIPVDDASDKKMYKEIPLVFKVKSELSLKRAKKLIDDLMAKKGLPQQEIPFLPWSKAFQK